MYSTDLHDNIEFQGVISNPMFDMESDEEVESIPLLFFLPSFLLFFPKTNEF